jgi:lysophospholipase L1-like esterase
MNQFYRFRFLACCFLLTLFFMPPSVGAQQVAPFKNGDKIVFMGNSITDGGHYHSYVWLYYMTHFPAMRIEIVNAGIGGDVCRQMLERLDDEVFSKNPSVMTFTFGMNDTGYQNLSPSKADSVYVAKVGESLKYFKLVEVELNKHPEVKKIMLASPPYDETSKIKSTPLLKKNAAILTLVAEQRDAATRNGWGFIDFNTPMLLINQRGQQTDSTFTMESPDRIHPSNDGQMVMAYTFLNAQGLAGQKVADAVVSSKAKKIEKCNNCSLANLASDGNRVSFDYLARSLPYPLDTIPGGFGKPARSQADALKLISFTNDYNQEIISVKGLKDTSAYNLTIDKKTIGQWTGADFAKGINLALITSTPQYQQALAVMQLNEERWTIERRLREYYWLQYSILKPKGLLFNDAESTMDSLQKYAKKDFFVAVTIPTYQKARFKVVRDAWKMEMDLLTDEIYKVNQPTLHHFEITLCN